MPADVLDEVDAHVAQHEQGEQLVVAPLSSTYTQRSASSAGQTKSSSLAVAARKAAALRALLAEAGPSPVPPAAASEAGALPGSTLKKTTLFPLRVSALFFLGDSSEPGNTRPNYGRQPQQQGGVLHTTGCGKDEPSPRTTGDKRAERSCLERAPGVAPGVRRPLKVFRV